MSASNGEHWHLQRQHSRPQHLQWRSRLHVGTSGGTHLPVAALRCSAGLLSKPAKKNAPDLAGCRDQLSGNRLFSASEKQWLVEGILNHD